MPCLTIIFDLKLKKLLEKIRMVFGKINPQLLNF